MIEQITGRTDNELQRAVGKNAGLCNHPGEGMCEIGCDRCRFGHNWNAGQQGGGKLLQ